MIRNWYNLIPYSALQIKREITKYINWHQLTKGTRANPVNSSFPGSWSFSNLNLTTCKICHSHNRMDGWDRVLRPFNSISVISRRWKGEHERLCAMKRRLDSGRISPPAGFEPATPWSEVGSAKRSATRTLLHIIGEPKNKYGQQEQVTVRNHNISTALEQSKLKYWGWGLKRFYGIPTSPSASGMAKKKYRQFFLSAWRFSSSSMDHHGK